MKDFSLKTLYSVIFNKVNVTNLIARIVHLTMFLKILGFKTLENSIHNTNVEELIKSEGPI